MLLLRAFKEDIVVPPSFPLLPFLLVEWSSLLAPLPRVLSTAVAPEEERLSSSSLSELSVELVLILSGLSAEPPPELNLFNDPELKRLSLLLEEMLNLSSLIPGERPLSSLLPEDEKLNLSSL